LPCPIPDICWIKELLFGLGKTGFFQALVFAVHYVFSVGRLCFLHRWRPGRSLGNLKISYSFIIYWFSLWSFLFKWWCLPCRKWHMFAFGQSCLHYRDLPWFGADYPYLYCGFIKSIPLEIEEAATIDGCTRSDILSCRIPILRPILRFRCHSKYHVDLEWLSITISLWSVVTIKTIPIAVQYLQGGYGSKDMELWWQCLF